MTIINLATPIGREKVRWFQPPWRTVFVYKCAQGHTVRVFANSFRGGKAEPSVGGISCPQCPANLFTDLVVPMIMGGSNNG